MNTETHVKRIIGLDEFLYPSTATNIRIPQKIPKINKLIGESLSFVSESLAAVSFMPETLVKLIVKATKPVPRKLPIHITIKSNI